MKKTLFEGILLFGMSSSMNAGDFEDAKKHYEGGDAYGCSDLTSMYKRNRI